MIHSWLDHPICLQAPRWLSGRSAWTHHIPFALAVTSALRPRLFVELGTQYADSYHAFCQAVQELRIETTCFAVDTWCGDPHSGVYGRDVQRKVREHHDSHYAPFSTLLQAEFDAARPRFQDGSIDLLHIDGYHTYEAVRHDFETWLPAMSSRGVILFHDTQVRERDFGVWKFWQEVATQYEHFELAQVFGLGVLAVGHGFPEPFRAMLRAAREPEFHAFFDVLGVKTDRMAGAVQQHRKLQAQVAAFRDHYGQIRFRLADKANAILRRMGKVHSFARNALTGNSSVPDKRGPN